MTDGPNDTEARKKAIFDSMSPRGQKRILKMGYEKWNPFEEPKDPIDIRRDATRRTTQQLVREFLQQCGQEKISNAYSRGVLEMALGIINSDDRFVGMFEFAAWYIEQLKAVEEEESDR